MDSILTVRELRRLWKPTKDRLSTEAPGHPTPIRFHRACSWMQRAEPLNGSTELDLALMCQWIAFNSLYGQWDEIRREPKPDRACWRTFLDRIIGLDGPGRVSSVLISKKDLVVSILDDEYLSDFFWAEPGADRARKSKKAKFDARTWYIQGKWSLILDRLLERIHLLRCQLVHGAATHGSRLNRTSLKRCSAMLGHLLPAVLMVIIDHGAEEDWGAMCYPPLNSPTRSDEPGVFA